jgi:hypothetical protein
MSSVAWTSIKDVLHNWVRDAGGFIDERVLWSGQNLSRPAGRAAWCAMRMMSIESVGQDEVFDEDNTITVNLLVSAIDVTANTLTSVAHGRALGDGPVQVTSSVTMPGGLAALTNYWLITPDANSVKLATTFLNARAGIAVDITSAGAGTIAIVSTSETVPAGAELRERVVGPRKILMNVTCYPAFVDDDQAPDDAAEAPAILTDLSTACYFTRYSQLFDAAGVAVSPDRVQALDGVQNTARFEPRATMMVTLLVKSELVDTKTIIETINVQNATNGDTFSVSLA